MSIWYYALDNGQQGPVTPEELVQLRLDGTLDWDTLVWREGMEQWKPMREAAAELAFADNRPPPRPAEAAQPAIAPDGSPPGHGADNTATSAGYVVHAGFWRRWAALFLDQIIISAVFYVLLFVLIVAIGIGGALASMDSEDPPMWVVFAYIGLMLLYYVGAGLYYSLMESSRHQASVGKLALGIKVVDGEGRRISFGRALGRWFAASLSYMTLYIGFIMAAFTQRKQALHDMLANTQVVDRWAYTEYPERQRQGLGGCLIAIIVGVLLLFVVAVLGILAAIAIPAYQDYTQRSNVNAAMLESAPIRAMVAEHYATTGECPVNGSDGIGSEESLGSTFTTRITVGRFENGSCALEQELGNTGHDELDDGMLWWQYDDGEWLCSSDIADRHLPQSCQG